LYTVSLLNNTQRHGINRDSLKRNLIRHAERAAELRPDSRLIEHYQALIYLYQWRWRAALREIRRGRPAGRLSQRQIQLEAVLHGLLGDHATSLRMCREALELDPANAEAHQLLSFCYETAGQIDNAATSIRDAIKLRPTYSNYYRHLVRREIALGHHTEAAKVLQLTERLGAAIDEPAFDADLCYFYGRLGEGNAAEAAFSRLAQHTERIGEGNWALAYLGLLDREKALQHIAAAVAKVETWQEDDGFWSLNIVRTNCANDPILNEPEFVELRKRLTPND
jgi:tetratricopeptide (TPR) repeat protein